MKDVIFTSISTFVIVLCGMKCIELIFVIRDRMQSTSNNLIESDRLRMWTRRIIYWWSWKKADYRRARWLQRHLYPPKFHPEYQALLLVAIGAHHNYIESLDPSPTQRERLGKKHQELLDDYVEKMMSPLDPSTIQ